MLLVAGPTVLSWKRVSNNSNNPNNRFEYLTTAGHVMGGEGRITVEIEEDKVMMGGWRSVAVADDVDLFAVAYETIAAFF